MPHYHYTVYRDGHRLTGRIKATTADEAAVDLQQQGLVVTQLYDSEKPAGYFHLNLASNHLSVDEKIFLVQNLATFLGSGIPITEALRITASDATSPRLSSMLDSITFDLKSGKTFATSLGKFPDSFDSIFLALVDSGEQTGMLKEIFSSLADKYKQDRQTISRIRSAFIYPGIVFIALVILSVILAFFVLPKMTDVFRRFAVDLPFITEWLLAGSQLLNKQPILSLLVLTGLATTTIGFLVSRTGHRFLAFMGSRLPVIKDTFWYLDLERFTSTLRILLEAGVPIQQALKVAGKTVTHPALTRQIPIAAEELSSGRSLATSLEMTILPHTVISLLAAGEQSGNLAGNLGELEHFYRDHLDEALRNLTALIEPLMTLFVGLTVGAVVVSIIIPIYQLVGNLNGAS